MKNLYTALLLFAAAVFFVFLPSSWLPAGTPPALPPQTSNCVLTTGGELTCPGGNFQTLQTNGAGLPGFVSGPTFGGTVLAQFPIDEVGVASAPSNPGAGNCRQYYNSTSGVVAWINSSGGNCGPSGTFNPASNQTITGTWTFSPGALFGGPFDEVGVASAPSNPAAGNCRQYYNTTSGVVAWLNSSGGNCGPSGTFNPASNQTISGNWVFSPGLVSNGSFTLAGPKPFIDITSTGYGADPTGATDSTTAINNAIAACGSNYHLYVPSGTYQIRGNLAFNSANCRVEGENGQSIFQRWSGVTTTADFVDITAPTYIRGITFDGNNSLLTSSSPPCGSGNANHGCGALITVKNTTQVTLENNVMQNCGGNIACVFVTSVGTSTGHVYIRNNRILTSSTGTGGNSSFADAIFVANSGSSGGALNYVFIQSNDIDASGSFGYSIALDAIGLHATNPNQDFGTMDVSFNKTICPSNANHGFCIEVGEFIKCGNVACGTPSARPHNISVTHNVATASASAVGFFSLTSCSYCNFDFNSTHTNGFDGINSGMELSFSDHSTAIGNAFGDCENSSSNGLPFGFLMVDSNFMTVEGNAVCGVNAVNGAAAFLPTTSNLPPATISTITGSGTTYTITTSSAYDTSQQFSQGTYLYLSNATPSAFDGVWRITGNPSSTTLTVLIPTTGLTCSSSCGTIGGSSSNNNISGNVFSFPDAGVTSTIFGILEQASAANSGMINNEFMMNSMLGNLSSGAGETAFGLTAAGSGALVDNTMIEGNILRNTSYGMFIGSSGVTNTFIKGNNIYGFTTAQIQSAGNLSIQFTDEPIDFAALGTCNATLEGNEAVVNDVTAGQSWNTHISAGGATGSGIHYKLYCDGSNWTVAAN